MFENPSIPIWPSINASFNALAAFFLLIGYVAIKSKAVRLHRTCMGLAVLASMIFLVCYLYYHFNYDAKPFQGQGFIRYFYFTMLLSHIVFAVGILPFIIRLLQHALKGRFVQHRKLARWVWPLWMYTSVTGILIYFFLYHWFNEQGAMS